LDEECNFPKASDATLLEKLHKNCGTKDQKFYEKPKLTKTNFGIIHYAGKVNHFNLIFLFFSLLHNFS